MEITLRALITMIHGMLFGAFFLMATYGLVVELSRSAYVEHPSKLTNRGYSLERLYLFSMVALGWAAVLTGAYIIYPWYRAVPPSGVTDLALYPRYLLKSSATTSGWHDLGMEWKEHVAWIAPIAMTMVAYVFTKYRLLIAGTSTSPQSGSGLRTRGVWSGRRGRIFWRDDQQVRALKRRFHNPSDGEKPMNHSERPGEDQTATPRAVQLPNGPAGAAILSAGAGCTFMGILSVVADSSKPIAKLLTFYLPTGSLSGVSSVAILLWLVTWFILAKRWRVRTVAIRKVNFAAFVLLALGVLLTFPPFAELLSGL